MNYSKKANDKQILFNYLDTIPFIKILSDSNPLVGSMARMLIPKILMTGIEEEYPSGSRILQTRYALSVREIMEQLNISAKKHFNIDKEFKLTNVYFHLEKLEEAGLVQEVASFTIGKRKRTAYFGNTAIVFIFREDSQLYRNNELLKFMKSSIPQFNPSISENEIQQVFDKHSLQPDKEITAKIEKWYEKNKATLLESNINYHALYVYLEMILSATPELTTLYSKLSSMLNL